MLPQNRIRCFHPKLTTNVCLVVNITLASASTYGLRCPDTIGARGVMTHFAFGGMDYEEGNRNMKLFADKVLPGSALVITRERCVPRFDLYQLKMQNMAHSETQTPITPSN